jgi:hypothetical protein
LSGVGTTPLARHCRQLRKGTTGGHALADQSEGPLPDSEVGDVGAEGIDGAAQIAAEYDGEVVGHVTGG